MMSCPPAQGQCSYGHLQQKYQQPAFGTPRVAGYSPSPNALPPLPFDLVHELAIAVTRSQISYQLEIVDV